jgi:antiphage defense system Thoeris ThsB-like protein
MAKRVYFCFHHQDLVDWRVQVVRNHWLSREGHEDAGLFDEPTWDESSMSGQAAIKRLINSGLENTSATCVLIGTQTWQRRWVRYEIIESVQRGNRIIAVHVNGIADRNNRIKPEGRNPLEHLALSFPNDGASVQVLQYAHGAWIPAIDTTGWRLSKPASEKRRGKTVQLSLMYPVHDWVRDNGLEHLDRWLDG